MRILLVALGMQVAMHTGVSRILCAQDRPWALTVGGAVGLVRPTVFYETPGVAGGGIGIELGREAVRLRITANHATAFRGGDDVSICRPHPNYPGVCYVAPYRRIHVMYAGDVLVQPSGLGPFYVLGGGSVARMHGRVRESIDPMPEARYLWRAGGGVTLGSSRRAPRLELVRANFAGSVGAAKHLLLLQLWLR